MTSQGIVWVQWVLRKQTDLVLERALLGGEAVAERLELVFVGGGGQLGLDTRLEAGLGLGHELGARVVPRAKVGGGDRHGEVAQVPHLSASANPYTSVSTRCADRWRRWAWDGKRRTSATRPAS